MNPYSTKSYGRNDEVTSLIRLFENGRDVSMHGPRRLGKTFVLDRLVDIAPTSGWTAVKSELAGFTDPRGVFRQLCQDINKRRTMSRNVTSFVLQRGSQVLHPRSDPAGPWYQPIVSLDHEAHFQRLVEEMNADRSRRWALLIDELPIFLKALHDKGTDGIAAARDFMNMMSRLRQGYPRVRWMVTGSIGIEPLARAGQYRGVLAKFQAFVLQPLAEEQAVDYVRDLATEGRLLNRTEITNTEAKALVEAVGWRAAFYLDALAQKLKGKPTHISAEAQTLVDAAVDDLLQPSERMAFGIWEEHLDKHYHDEAYSIAVVALRALSARAQGLALDELLAIIGRPALTRERLRDVLIRLHDEGFISVDAWTREHPHLGFQNPLLRRWWQLYGPSAAK